MTDRGADGPWEFKPHWLTLFGPAVRAIIGVVLYKFARDFFTSSQGEALLGPGLLQLGQTFGAPVVRTIERFAEPVGVGFLLLFFILPLGWAWLVRETTQFSVDHRQIIWRRGVIARAITQVEIGEIVGVNVYESIMGRLFGYGTVDVETRGEDRLVAKMLDGARGFAGLVLDLKHRQPARAAAP
jgi:hypothetical protein